MKLRLSIWSIVVVAVALSSVVLLSSDQALASNMGFKMNKVVEAKVFPNPKGENLVALPYRSPYQNADDVCSALGLSDSDPLAKVSQLDPRAGGTFGQTSSYNCQDLVGAFSLIPRVGVTVFSGTTAGGILVGSHQGNPPGGMILKQKVFPAPQGDYYFPVPYHTTAVNAQDLCTDLNLPTAAPGTKILRLDALAGVKPSHDCGAAGAFPLVLGESVLIQILVGASDVTVAAGHPAHF